jgi:hypothetical protein
MAARHEGSWQLSAPSSDNMVFAGRRIGGTIPKKALQFYGSVLSHFPAKYLISLARSSPARNMSAVGPGKLAGPAMSAMPRKRRLASRDRPSRWARNGQFRPGRHRAKIDFNGVSPGYAGQVHTRGPDAKVGVAPPQARRGKRTAAGRIRVLLRFNESDAMGKIVLAALTPEAEAPPFQRTAVGASRVGV